MTQKTILLLAMHGMPPNDFPKGDLSEWGRLHSSLEQAQGEERRRMERRYADLDGKLRSWPRTPENDLFHAASQDLARQLADRTGLKVLVAFNEFCAPSLEEGFALAAREADKVVVLTPMMIRGGSHSETDIPAAIGKAKKKFPRLAIDYVWPYEDSKIAEFLAQQTLPYLNPVPTT